MGNNGSQPGTSAGSGNTINNTFSRCNIDNFNQHNHLSTTSTRAPRRNPIENTERAVNTFIGRKKELSDITKLFHKYPVVVIAAMGGMGKTQLARKFACVNADVYRDICWINAETEEQLLKSFDRLAKKVKVEANTDIDTVRDTYRFFIDGAALFIFDNVEHVNNVYKYLPTRIQLKDQILHVLVTSRWTEWTSDSSVNCYQLQPFDISISLQLFQRTFGQTCIETMRTEWEKLARMLGYLPLALQVATSYIYKRNKHNPDLPMVLADYMKQLKEEAGKLLNVPIIEYENQSVSASMLLTLKHLQSKSDEEWKFAVILVSAAAYMYPDRIHKEHLLKLLNKDQNTCILDEALAIITEFSLFNQIDDRRGKIYYSVHRIIQISFRHNQTTDIYYIAALKYALADDYFARHVFYYANGRASAVAQYYIENPSESLLICLMQYNAVTAVQAVFDLMCKDQIRSLINNYDLLYYAVGSGDLRMIKLLCKNGANINQLSRAEGETALHYVCWKGNIEIVKWLLQNDADPTVRDRAGRNALHAACMSANHKIASDIIQRDRGIVQISNSFFNQPIQTIGYSNSEEDIISTIRVFSNNAVDITPQDILGDTILHLAARNARAAVVSFILELKKDLVNFLNKEGQNALHVLGSRSTNIVPFQITQSSINLFQGFKETARVLIKNGLSLDTKDNEERTPLDTVKPEFKDVLRQVADEFDDNQLNITGQVHSLSILY